MTAEQLQAVKCAPLELAVTQQISTSVKDWFCDFLRELPHRLAFQIANHHLIVD